MPFFSGWFSEHLSGSAGDSVQRGEGNCLLEAGVVAFGLGFLFISLRGMRERLVDGVGSSKANKQILSDYSRMEIQDGRVLPNGLLRGIVYIPLMKDGEAISLRWTAVENGDLLRFRFQK
jgi:hypothetical protein